MSLNGINSETRDIFLYLCLVNLQSFPFAHQLIRLQKLDSVFSIDRMLRLRIDKKTFQYFSKGFTVTAEGEWNLLSFLIDGVQDF